MQFTLEPEWECAAIESAFGNARHLVALDRVARDCGLRDIVGRVWVAPVNAVIPGLGFHIYWHAVWMERAPGVSVQSIVTNPEPEVARVLALNLIQARWC